MKNGALFYSKTHNNKSGYFAFILQEDKETELK